MAGRDGHGGLADGVGGRRSGPGRRPGGGQTGDSLVDRCRCRAHGRDSRSRLGIRRVFAADPGDLSGPLDLFDLVTGVRGQWSVVSGQWSGAHRVGGASDRQLLAAGFTGYAAGQQGDRLSQSSGKNQCQLVRTTQLEATTKLFGIDVDIATLDLEPSDSAMLELRGQPPPVERQLRDDFERIDKAMRRPADSRSGSCFANRRRTSSAHGQSLRGGVLPARPGHSRRRTLRGHRRSPAARPPGQRRGRSGRRTWRRVSQRAIPGLWARSPNQTTCWRHSRSRLIHSRSASRCQCSPTAAAGASLMAACGFANSKLFDLCGGWLVSRGRASPVGRRGGGRDRCARQRNRRRRMLRRRGTPLRQTGVYHLRTRDWPTRDGPQPDRDRRQELVRVRRASKSPPIPQHKSATLPSTLKRAALYAAIQWSVACSSPTGVKNIRSARGNLRRARRRSSRSWVTSRARSAPSSRRRRVALSGRVSSSAAARYGRASWLVSQR